MSRRASPHRSIAGTRCGAMGAEPRISSPPPRLAQLASTYAGQSVRALPTAPPPARGLAGASVNVVAVARPSCAHCACTRTGGASPGAARPRGGRAQRGAVAHRRTGGLTRHRRQCRRPASVRAHDVAGSRSRALRHLGRSPRRPH